ncbi:MAG: GNAT family N-acetyltransferase [Candidatus Aenigmarchaeota archaeon]|nr:GNAT family N-acetyltransferase [Candidatus Aenigmarchaeota archaeon]
MLSIRSAKLQDIRQIQKVEKEYYEGFSCPEETLSNWIMGLSENFLVAEEGGRIVGFIFFECVNEAAALPFVHKLEHDPEGKFVYVSEVGVLDEFRGSDVLQRLFDRMVQPAEARGRSAVVWVTGEKGKHDRTEKMLLLANGFKKRENVKHWEAFPGFFVDDHWIWVKGI